MPRRTSTKTSVEPKVEETVVTEQKQVLDEDTAKKIEEMYAWYQRVKSRV